MGYRQVSEAKYQQVLVDNPRLYAVRYREGKVLVTEYCDTRGFIHALRRGNKVYVHASYVRTK